MIVVVAIVAETMDQTRGQPAPKVNAHRNVRKTVEKEDADVAVGAATRLDWPEPYLYSIGPFGLGRTASLGCWRCWSRGST